MKEAFIKLIDSSHLAQSDKDMWHEVLKVLDADQVQTLADFVEQDPKHGLAVLTENMKQKRHALLANDGELLKKIHKEEESYISSL